MPTPSLHGCIYGVIRRRMCGVDREYLQKLVSETHISGKKTLTILQHIDVMTNTMWTVIRFACFLSSVLILFICDFDEILLILGNTTH